MKIKGFPAHIWHGDAEVYAHGNQCPLLQACNVCDFHCHTYYLCVRGHVICPECHGRNKSSGDQAPCKNCTKQAFRITIPADLVERMQFRCGCGALGNLNEIRVHRESFEYSEKCEEPRDDDDPVMVALKADLDEAEMVLNTMKNEMQVKLDRIRSISTNLTVELVEKERVERSKLSIEELRKRADEMVLIYHELRDENQQVRAMLDAVTSPSTLLTFSIKDIIDGCKEEKIIALACMRVETKLILGPDGLTDLFVKASFRRGSRHPRNLVGKLLIVRHLDQNGYTLKEVSFEIQPNGTLGLGKLIHPFLDHAEKRAYERARGFIERTYMFGPAAQMSDSIHISVELCPGSTPYLL